MNGVRTVKGKLVRKAGEKEWRVQWETKKVDTSAGWLFWGKKNVESTVGNKKGGYSQPSPIRSDKISPSLIGREELEIEVEVQVGQRLAGDLASLSTAQ